MKAHSIRVIRAMLKRGSLSPVAARDSNQMDNQKELRTILNHDNRGSHTNPLMQTKIAVGEANDPLESEADRVADAVVSDRAVPKISSASADTNHSTNSTASRATENTDETMRAQSEGEREEMSESESAQPLFRKEASEDDEPAQASLLQAKGTPEISDEAQQKIDRMRGTGSELPEELRREMEQKIGADFSAVRIHIGPQAAEISKQVNARAFTIGNEIYFNSGEYDPKSEEGKKLIAHELTHVVQQSSGAQASFMQRDEDDVDNPPAGGTQEYTAQNGEYANSKIDVSSRRLEVSKISLPRFKRRNRDKFSAPIVMGRGRGTTTQGTQWDNYVDAGVRRHVATNIAAAQRLNGVNSAGQYFFYGRDDRSFILFGNEETLIQRFKRPFWDQRTRPFTGQIDHIVERQLSGDDTPENFEFLEASANMSSGNRIAEEINNRIRGAVGAIRDEASGNTNIPRPSRLDYIKNNYRHIQFNSFDFNLGNVSGEPNKYWPIDKIRDGEQGDLLRPMSEARLRRLGRTSSPLRIYASPSGGRPMPRLPASAMQLWVPRVRFMGWEPAENDDGEEAGIVSVDVFKSGRSENVQLTKSSEFADYLEEWPVRRIGGAGDNFINGGYLVPHDKNGGGVTGISGGARQSLRLPGMSPVQMDSLEFGPQGFIGRGRVLPTVPLIREANIEILLSGNEVQLRKTFDLGEFDIPSPFEINDANLTVFFSNTRGLGVEGRLGFEIERLGEGFLGAAASTEGGFSLEGEFNFDERIFGEGTQAQVRVGYSDNQWSLGGTISIPEGKVPGVNSATINVDYSEGDGFSASGDAELNVPGVESGRLEITHNEESGFSIGGEFDLSSDAPGIRSGSISARVQEREDGSGYAVSATGTAVPDIPGINSQLDISYNDGAFTAEVTAQYQRGMLSGEINAGVTNRTVNEETGELAETAEEGNPLVVYGGGSLTLQLAPWLQGTAGVRFSPNGELTVTGEIGLPSDLEIFPRRELNKSIFNIAVQAPIIPGIVAEIGGGLSATAGIGPGVIDELRLGIEYNPDREQDTTITGDAHLSIPANAGLRLSVRAGVGLGITGASATGGLEIGGTLGIEGAAEAGVHIEWSPSRGLDIRARVGVHAQPSFTFDISGYVSVRALGFSVYDERWQLASYTFGSDYRFGISLPIHYQEGQPFDISLNDVEFEVPDIDTSRLLRGLISRIS